MAHVFISYVREDAQSVDSLCDSLRENGVKIWIDRNDIPPGARWKKAIRKAINEGDFFIACFSPSYIKKEKTYMNEELTIAIEILRQKPVDRAWFIPVLLSQCEVPDRDIGAGETLLDLQQVRLYEDWEIGIKHILSVVKLDDSGSGGITQKTEEQTISVLFLAANPFNTNRLRLDQEVREIQSTVIQSQLRDRFNFEMRWVSRSEELLRAFSTIRPRIVHFVGHHGSKSGAVVLEDSSGQSRTLSTNALTSLFSTVRDTVDCVILNVPYSSEMATAIAKEVKYVIGISKEISDRALIAFAVAFYRSLASGCSIEEAFKVGCTEITLAGFAASGTPVLIMRG